jgi:8-oxo-dGTP diphosphatase
MVKTQHDSETNANGQQVIVACALIHHDFDGVEKVFLPKRADTKKFMPGVYELPGGHVDFGEDIVAGLKREVMEEFGKAITVGDPFAAFTYTNAVKGSHSIEVAYFAQFQDDIENIAINPEDHSGYNWFSEDEIDAMLVGGKTNEDEEYQLIRRAFGILRSEPLNFGI